MPFHKKRTECTDHIKKKIMTIVKTVSDVIALLYCNSLFCVSLFCLVCLLVCLFFQFIGIEGLRSYDANKKNIPLDVHCGICKFSFTNKETKALYYTIVI